MVLPTFKPTLGAYIEALLHRFDDVASDSEEDDPPFFELHVSFLHFVVHHVDQFSRDLPAPSFVNSLGDPSFRNATYCISRERLQWHFKGKWHSVHVFEEADYALCAVLPNSMCYFSLVPP